MKTTIAQTTGKPRKGEQGAALITALLVSLLLLVVGGGLLATTSMTTTTTFDATTEEQAYYGAEAGLQAALNVLRGNAAPDPLFVSNPTGGVANENKLTFRKAVMQSTSNKSTDPTTLPDGSPFPMRLSRWLQYNYTPPAGAYPDRATISSNYSPLNGIAYSIVVSDPDDPLGTILATSPTYQPTRLLVTATGYGPKGAVKRMDALVDRFAFNIVPPAPIVIRGADNPSSDMTFDLGSSNSKIYSGADNAGQEPQRPTVAISRHDLATALAGITKGATVADPKLSILDLDVAPPPYPSAVTPPFLVTANAARAFLGEAEIIARDTNRYFTSFNGFAGSMSSPAFTFVDGDCFLEGGAGLLIVRGTLTLKGNNSFYGLILVLGSGNVTRSGGGNGFVYGAFEVAKFDRTSGDFLAPYFDVSGGGASIIQYDSVAVGNANTTAGRGVRGVAEALAR